MHKHPEIFASHIRGMLLRVQDAYAPLLYGLLKKGVMNKSRPTITSKTKHKLYQTKVKGSQKVEKSVQFRPNYSIFLSTHDFPV